jgi:hypothetical protein
MAVYTLTVEYTIEGDSEVGAHEAFDEGEYSDIQRVSIVKEKETPIHIAYSVKEGHIKYRASDGSTGVEPFVDTALFEKYWENHYKPREVTFEGL